MAVPTYSTVFFSVPGLQNELYLQVPAGQTWVIRDITAWANGPTGSDSFIWVAEFIGTPSYNKIAWWWHDHTLGPALYHWQGRQVFASPQQLAFHVDGFPADLRVSGYVLTTTP